MQLRLFPGLILCAEGLLKGFTISHEADIRTAA